MSIEQVKVKCNLCPGVSNVPAETAPTARDAAKANGWLYVNGNDICPDCKNAVLAASEEA